MTDRLLRTSDVLERTSVSRRTIYDWMRDGLFPRPIQIGPRAVRWLESEVDEWFASRPRADIQVNDLDC